MVLYIKPGSASFYFRSTFCEFYKYFKFLYSSELPLSSILNSFLKTFLSFIRETKSLGSPNFIKSRYNLHPTDKYL